MRSFIVMAMFVASLASTAWKEHTEARDLQLPAEGITVFELDTGAGSLTIKGMLDAHNIRVKAIIRVPNETEERAQKIIASDMKLTLEKSRDHARIKTKFDSKIWGGDVFIDDGSGGFDVSDVEHDLIIIGDGSGEITVSNVRGSVKRDKS